MSLIYNNIQYIDTTSSKINEKDVERVSLAASLDLLKPLRQGIWLYFILLIFEGALRKWLLPSLATPLLIVRDPLALWLIVKAWNRGLLHSNPYMFFMTSIGIVGIFTAIFLGHGNLLVAIYGARIMLFHFPLFFVIGRVFDRGDVIKMGKILLWMATPMTILIALQFYSPQSAWVNRGVGGDMAGAGFGGALGYFRPPGTFSFTNGTTLYYGFLTSFVFYFWINHKGINRLLLVCATASLLTAVPLSISRGLFFQVCISLVFAIIAISRKPKYMGRFLLALFGGIVVLAILSKISFFDTATNAFTNRFDGANEQEGGLKSVLGDRYLGGMIGALSTSSERPFFGYGLGMGTNVGSMLLVNGRTFLIAEEEWARIIGELGPLMGFGVILIRLGVSLKIALASYRKLILNDLLPWMLLSYALLQVPQGQWAQPTSLGFSIMIGGLIISSLKDV